MMPPWWEEEHRIRCTLAGPSYFPASKDAASWPRGAPWDHCCVIVVDHCLCRIWGIVLGRCPSQMHVTGLGG